MALFLAVKHFKVFFFFDEAHAHATIKYLMIVWLEEIQQRNNSSE